MLRSFASAVLFGVSAFFGPAHAEVVSGVNASELGEVMNAANLNPVLQRTQDGAPVATGEVGQFKFYVRGLSCSGEPASCGELLFFANFKLGRTATDRDFRIVNSFNDSQVFGRAYVLERTGEVGVDYVIELGGGVTEEHLSENIGRWADVMEAFFTKFTEGLAAS